MSGGLRTLLEVVPTFTETLGRHLAWSRQLNLLACDLVPPPDSQTLRICILNPACPEGHEVLEMPTADELLSLIWSPLGLPPALLALTKAGTAYVWMQSPMESPSEELPVTTDTWFGKMIFQTKSKPVAADWMMGLDVYSWPPVVSIGNTVVTLQTPFLHPSADLCLHWARAGVMSCAVLTQTGDVEVHYRSMGGHWKVGATLSAEIGASTAVEGDVVASRNATMRVALMVPDEATSVVGVAVFHVTGDPLCLSAAGVPLQPLVVERLGLVTPHEGDVIISARFWPGSAGEALLITQQNRLSGMVSLVRYEQPAVRGAASQWTRSFASDVASVLPVPHVPPVPPIVVAASDGSQVLAVVDSKTLGFFNGRLRELLKVDGWPARVMAAAPSPNSEAWALVGMPAGASRPVLRIVALESPQALGIDLVEHFGYRVSWSVVTGGHHWDVVTALRAADAAAPAAAADGCAGARPAQRPPGVLAGVLWRVDNALHAQPYHSASSYGTVVARVKIAALRGTTDPVAQAVYQDMWLRGMMATLDPVIRSVASQGTNGRIEVAPDYLAACGGWINYVKEVVRFFVQCLRLYTHLKADKSPEAQKAADAVPAVRLMADTNFMTHITQDILAVAQAAASPTTSLLHSLMKRLEIIRMLLLRQLPSIDRKMMEMPGNASAVALQATSAFGGDYALHLPRTYGPVDLTVYAWFLGGGGDPVPSFLEANPADPQGKAREADCLIKAREAALIVNNLQLPEPTWEVINEAAARLGLRRGLPDPVTKADGVFAPATPTVLEPARGVSHLEVLAPLPVNELGPLLGPCLGPAPGWAGKDGQSDGTERPRKRRAWTHLHAAALGLQPSSEARLAAGQPDILSGVRLQAQCPPTYASTDGLCFTAELRPNPPAEWNTLPRLLRRHYMAACPVTLSGWRRLRS